MAKKHTLVKDVLLSLVWSSTGKTFNALYQQNGQNNFQKTCPTPISLNCSSKGKISWKIFMILDPRAKREDIRCERFRKPPKIWLRLKNCSNA